MRISFPKTARDLSPTPTFYTHCKWSPLKRKVANLKERNLPPSTNTSLKWRSFLHVRRTVSWKGSPPPPPPPTSPFWDNSKLAKVTFVEKLHKCSAQSSLNYFKQRKCHPLWRNIPNLRRLLLNDHTRYQCILKGTKKLLVTLTGMDKTLLQRREGSNLHLLLILFFELEETLAQLVMCSQYS